MSNQLVGAIYARIISDVIAASQVDFEEGGVDTATLDEMKQGWQEKLSHLGVATFPWDPPVLPAQLANPAPVPSNAPSTARTVPLPSTTTPSPNSSNAPSKQPTAAASNVTSEPMSEIKIENAQPSGNPGLGNPQAAAIAVQRAANLMQQKFGSQANNSIGAMQSSGLARQQSQAQASSSAQSSEQQHKNGAGPPQTDGPSSPVAETWTLVMRTRAANGADETVRVEADATIRQHVLAMGQEIEGGGLMLPLRERVKPVKSAIANRKKRKLATAAQSGPVENTFNAAAMPQLDGGLDSDSDAEDVIKDEAAPGLFDEEVDEDAINSDLDDPEENVESAEDDDEVIGPIMLCMYDKVQRVKNKWKCTLKDGVLTINRREYVFHKATGEFEW